MSPRRSALYYGALAILATLVLSQLPPLRQPPLRVPITYERDGLFLTILTKTIQEDGLLHATRFGAPFGTDLADWPIGMWLPFAQLAGLAALTGEPGTALNLHWMSTLVLAALAAAYALRRLRLPPALAFVLGVLYAFQPYAFYRNVEHVNLAFPFVPLIALLILRVAGTRPEDETPAERALTLAACVAQGLSYIYYSAFACLLLAAAAPIGWLRTRSPRPVRRAALAVVLLVACSAAAVGPTLVYWKRHGYNPDLDYKPPRETEVFALKLRHLLTPIADHPLAPFRAVASQLEAVGFADDRNESALSRLGSVGGLGLLGLLAFLLGRAAGLVPRRDEALDGAAPLALFTLLWATTGGFSSFFNVFVIPDIRCYTRIVVFLSFFCLLAFGGFATRAARLLPLAPRWRTPVRWAALLALLAAGLADQIPVLHLWTLREGTAAAFDEERQLVREVESRLPQGAMVFQLPHMTVPVDRATYPPMRYYDPGRAYLHSRTLRWSWGAMIGRHHDWGRAVDALPLPDKVRVLAEAGFSGIWIDRWGYTGTGAAGPCRDREAARRARRRAVPRQHRRTLLVRQHRRLPPTPGGRARAGATRPRPPRAPRGHADPGVAGRLRRRSADDRRLVALVRAGSPSRDPQLAPGRAPGQAHRPLPREPGSDARPERLRTGRPHRGRVGTGGLRPELRDRRRQDRGDRTPGRHGL